MRSSKYYTLGKGTCSYASTGYKPNASRAGGDISVGLQRVRLQGVWRVRCRLASSGLRGDAFSGFPMSLPPSRGFLYALPLHRNNCFLWDSRGNITQALRRARMTNIAVVASSGPNRNARPLEGETSCPPRPPTRARPQRRR